MSLLQTELEVISVHSVSAYNRSFRLLTLVSEILWAGNTISRAFQNNLMECEISTWGNTVKLVFNG